MAALFRSLFGSSRRPSAPVVDASTSFAGRDPAKNTLALPSIEGDRRLRHSGNLEGAPSGAGGPVVKAAGFMLGEGALLRLEARLREQREQQKRSPQETSPE